MMQGDVCLAKYKYYFNVNDKQGMFKAYYRAIVALCNCELIESKRYIFI